MPTALSLFSGAGGLDLAARIAGIDVLLATDRDHDALAVLHSNLGTRTLAGDLPALLDGRLEAAWPAHAPPDLIIGGPPCTPFSHAGFWIDKKRDGEDPAVSLLSTYGEVVRRFRPGAFVLENVPGLNFKTHKRFLTGFIEQAEEFGYAVRSQILNASDFGVPQHRRRLFVVGTRGVDAPDLTDWPAWPTRTAGWALRGLTDRTNPPETGEAVGGKYRDLLPLIPPGGNYLHFTAERGCERPLFRYRGRYWSFLLKLNPEAPAPTLSSARITYNGPLHWENRHLRRREMARLQGLPDWYRLDHQPDRARQQIGNAVPPAMGAAVLARVLSALAEHPGNAFPEALERSRDRRNSPRTLWSDAAPPIHRKG